MISQDTLGRADALASSFAHARPFRHVVIDDFFQAAVAEEMLRQFPAETDPSKLLSEFGTPNPKKAISDVRGLGGIYAEIDRYIQTPEFLGFVERVTGIGGLRYDPHYFGAGTHENFHGAGLDPHCDFNFHPVTRQHRRLNAIVYLNRDWRPGWGGSIALHSDAWDLEGDEVTTIQPGFNRCVIFETTERSWHSVPVIEQPEACRHLSRKSFTIYLHTDQRPADEVAPSHGTVYVQTGLPGRIRPGTTLTEDDVAAIKANLHRRHDYLRHMYAREYRYSALIDELQARVAELEHHLGVPLAGPARLGPVAVPVHRDGWMGRSLQFEITPLEPMMRLRVVGHRPDNQVPIDLTLTVGSHAATLPISGDVDLVLACPSPAEAAVTVTLLAPAAGPFEGVSDTRDLAVNVHRIYVLTDEGPALGAARRSLPARVWAAIRPRGAG